MRVHYLQHVDFEDLGHIEEWINEKKHSVTATRFFENDALPDTDDFDFLIVLGGPMSIHDEDEHPWLKTEKEFLKKSISENKKIVGICLGSQLLADALGAKVYTNSEKEIGWFPIRKKDESRIIADFPNEFLAFHWHGDTFEIPDGATSLFSSEACKNQAFLYGANILALQFHLEVSQKSIEQMIRKGKHEIITGKFIQAEDELRNRTDLPEKNKAILFEMLNRL